MYNCNLFYPITRQTRNNCKAHGTVYMMVASQAHIILFFFCSIWPRNRPFDGVVSVTDFLKHACKGHMWLGFCIDPAGGCEIHLLFAQLS